MFYRIEIENLSNAMWDYEDMMKLRETAVWIAVSGWLVSLGYGGQSDYILLIFQT
jgi:hypothetical protein